MARLNLNVNNKAVGVDVPPEMPLLWVLRDELGLTGTKFGCGMALCGVAILTAVLTLSGCASVERRGGMGGVAPEGTESRSLELELDYTPGQPVMLPVPPPNVEQDREQAVREIESRRNTKALTRERPDESSPRPDLDHDVTQGIQSRGAQKALGR